MNSAALRELVSRLDGAERQLLKLAALRFNENDPIAATRLKGKAAGVALAKGYVEEAIRSGGLS